MEQENELAKEIQNAELKEKMKKRPYFKSTDETIHEAIKRRRDLLQNDLISEEEAIKLFEQIEGYENELKNRK
jgi:uncharacterized protein YwqG